MDMCSKGHSRHWYLLNRQFRTPHHLVHLHHPTSFSVASTFVLVVDMAKQFKSNIYGIVYSHIIRWIPAFAGMTEKGTGMTRERMGMIHRAPMYYQK